MSKKTTTPTSTTTSQSRTHISGLALTLGFTMYLIALFGAIWLGFVAGFVASLNIIHPYALAMGAGVGSGSMMAASSGAIAAAVPSMAKDILMYAGASNLLTSIIGVYFALFVSLPVTVFLYNKLSPIIGVSQRKRLEGGK